MSYLNNFEPVNFEQLSAQASWESPLTSKTSHGYFTSTTHTICCPSSKSLVALEGLVEWPLVPFTSSPLASVDGNSIHQRQQNALTAQRAQLATSLKLNTFM